MLVWLNGNMIDQNDACVSVFDAGLQHGVGLFETMLAKNGRVFRGREHLERLQASAHELRLTESLRIDPLLAAVELTLQRNDMRDARIRLTLTGGDLNLLSRQTDDSETNAKPKTTDPTILIHAQPPTAYPDAFFEDGIIVNLADSRLNPLDTFAGHKTLNYWPRLFALQHAAGVGAGESIWFTVSNHLAGGSVSNVFLGKNGCLLTPIARGEEVSDDSSTNAVTLPSPILPGITRQFVLETAREQSIEIDVSMLTIDDLLEADEVFLTNSSWGILPVVQVEREKISEGKVGSITQLVRQKWLAAME